MAEYASGWIGVVRNNLDQLQAKLDLLKSKIVESGRNPDNFEIIVIVYPNVSKAKTEQSKRKAFMGSLDQVGNDIDKLKEMQVSHIILNYNRSSIENDMSAIIDASKLLLSYAR